MIAVELAQKLQYLTPRQREIAQAALDWDYGTDPINRRPVLWRGRTVLDIGMGGGPHCIPFLLGGAAGYVGVDPLVGTDHVRDERSDSDPKIPPFHAFPYSVGEMRAEFRKGGAAPPGCRSKAKCLMTSSQATNASGRSSQPRDPRLLTIPQKRTSSRKSGRWPRS